MKKNTHTYFYTSFAAYIFGLGLTIFIMHIFKHAQVSTTPLCTGSAFTAGDRDSRVICAGDPVVQSRRVRDSLELSPIVIAR